jgi:hypothetical protein
MRKAFVFFAIASAAAATAFGQPNGTTATQTAAPSVHVWRIGAGYETHWLRDVSRTTRPVDASPVTWQGDGPAFEVAHDRSTASRLHRLRVNFSWTRGFEFSTPVGTIQRSAGEKSTSLAGRYEYRRYPFRNLWADGFDLGIGAEGGTVMGAITRLFDPAIELRQQALEATGAVTVAARVQRWRAVQFEIAWANGLTIGRSTTRHSTAVEDDVSAWGGGWLTDFVARADIRLPGAVVLFSSYFTTGRGRYQSHETSATGRSHFMIGLTHER